PPPPPPPPGFCQGQARIRDQPLGLGAAQLCITATPPRAVGQKPAPPRHPRPRAPGPPARGRINGLPLRVGEGWGEGIRPHWA
ncbi:hypothetical protein, partial [Enterobacter hormaechei]